MLSLRPGTEGGRDDRGRSTGRIFIASSQGGPGEDDVSAEGDAVKYRESTAVPLPDFDSLRAGRVSIYHTVY